MARIRQCVQAADRGLGGALAGARALTWTCVSSTRAGQVRRVEGRLSSVRGEILESRDMQGINPNTCSMGEGEPRATAEEDEIAGVFE